MEKDERALAPSQAILEELGACVNGVSEDELIEAKDALLHAKRIFAAGAGRSGLAVRMAAMRWMHLGLTVHVAGEVTTPAMATGDLLFIASGSGTTPSALQAAQTAKKVGAKILAFTTSPESPLGVTADHIIFVPAAKKQEHDRTISQQYAGTLFEQSVVLLSDTLFLMLWRQLGESAEQLWLRHANLE